MISVPADALEGGHVSTDAPRANRVHSQLSANRMEKVSYYLQRNSQSGPNSSSSAGYEDGFAL